MIADSNLTPIHSTPPWPRGPSFKSALSENIVTGCTAAMTAPAVRLLQAGGAPQSIVFHDWWCYLVVSAFGRVVYDPVPTVLYRQHGGNVVGHGAGWWGRQRQMLRYLLRNDWVGILSDQVNEFGRIYSVEMSRQQSELLDRYYPRINGRRRPGWRLIFSFQRWRQSVAHEFLFRALLAAHKLRLWPLRKGNFGISSWIV
jgi:hypothetical protein